MFGLFGCSSKRGLELSDKEWTARIQEAFEAIPEVVEIIEIGYTTVPNFGSGAGMVGGRLVTNAASDEENEAVAKKMAKVLLEALKDNYVSKCTVMLHFFYSGGERQLRYSDLIGKAAITLDDLAEYYGIPRHG